MRAAPRRRALAAAGALATTAAAVAAAVQCVRFASLERSDSDTPGHTLGSALQQFAMFDALRLASRWARRRHDRECADFDAVQRALLVERLQANAHTAYGADHQFERIAQHADPVAEFRARHPLTTYGHYQPYVARVAGGEQQVLNAERETQLAATSGTSSMGRAILPNTPAMGATFFTRGILVVFDTLLRSRFAAGGNDGAAAAAAWDGALLKSCKLAFAPRWAETAGGLRVGPNSSGPTDRSFARLLPLYSTPAAGYAIGSDDEGAALYVHALFALRDRRLGMIEANFVSMGARMLDVVAAEGERLAADLRAGTLDAAVAARLPAEQVAAIEAALGGGNPERADEVRAALRAGERGLVRRLWPSFRLFLANATGAFAPYAARLRSGYAAGVEDGEPPVPILSTVYAASEGLIGVALSEHVRPDGESVYCLVPRAMFFEFLPLEPAAADAATDAPPAGDGAPPRTLLGGELQRGCDYELVVTTLGGLCRYRLGDVVRCAGHHHGAPLVEFRYRQGQLLNLRGEKFNETQLADAFDAFGTAHAARGGASIIEYTSAEVVGGRAAPHYLLLLEMAGGAELPDDASRVMDAALCDANPVYATWRSKGAIACCEVRSCASGTFEKLRARRVEEGASPQQLKVSRVLRKEEHVQLCLENAK